MKKKMVLLAGILAAGTRRHTRQDHCLVYRLVFTLFLMRIWPEICS